VSATPVGIEPTVMSVGFLVLVFTSIVDTEPPPLLVTKAVGRHRERAATADTPPGNAPTSAPATPSPTTPRTQRMTPSCLAMYLGHRRHGVTATWTGDEPTMMSVGSLVRVFTSIVDTVGLPKLATKAVLPSGVTATPAGKVPTGMSVGSLVLLVTSIVDTVPPPLLVTKAVLPSGVTATPNGCEPTVMSVGFLVLVLTSIVDTESPPKL